MNQKKRNINMYANRKRQKKEQEESISIKNSLIMN